MIKVTIFNEYLHEKQKESIRAIYPDGIHGAIKASIEDEEIIVRTVTLDDPECGLTQEVLDDTDVIIWWGHMAHHMVPDEVAQRVRDAVHSGMGAIFLHSAHFSKPFKFLMGTPCSLTWRESGDSELLWVTDPAHPIVQGIDRFIHLPNEETYGEPFAIPNPDKVLLIGNYSGGEVFRSGCLYQRGAGKVFYFQPGHESYPIFYQAPVQTVITNAVRFVAPTYREVPKCPHVRSIGDPEGYVIVRKK